jgi:hypothetical protein
MQHDPYQIAPAFLRTNPYAGYLERQRRLPSFLGDARNKVASRTSGERDVSCMTNYAPASDQRLAPARSPFESGGERAQGHVRFGSMRSLTSRCRMSAFGTKPDLAMSECESPPCATSGREARTAAPALGA